MNRTRKRELRELNKLAWDEQKDVFRTAASLDSTLKKNTAVIKRLRTSLDSYQVLLREIQTVALEKYLPEVIAAVYEGLLKTKTASEIAAAVEVVSALHQRFQRDFTPQFTFTLAKGLATPRPDALKGLSPEQKEREEKERFARQRVLLRVGVELYLVGVVRSVQDAVCVDDSMAAKGSNGGAKPSGIVSGKDATKKKDGDTELDPFPLEVLKDLLNRDRDHLNLPLVVLFVKNFPYDMLGVRPRNLTRKNVEEDGATTAEKSANGEATNTDTDGTPSPDSTDPPLLSPELQQRFKNVLTRYLESVKSHIVRQHKHLQTQSARNAEAYVKSGEIFEDRQANYEKLVKTQEKFIANAQVVADVIGVEMPDLPDEKDGAEANGDSIIREGGSMFTSREDGSKFGIWEDEDQRRFYEDLIDLKARGVPAVLLEDGKKRKTEGEVKKSVEEDSVADDDSAGELKDTGASSPTDESNTGNDESTSTTIANKTIGAQVDALLVRLPELTNRDLIDQAAFEFCFLNSKASRNRLLKVLQDVPRGRQDLLPYYARLIATLNKYLPDIGKGMVEYLDKEFRSLQRRKDKELSEVRSRNVRYLSELTKFGIIPQHIIFYCLMVALQDFHKINIDVICNTLENCGKYLLRNPETSGRMTTFLETLKKKKDGIQYLGPQERVAIENAFYYVNPPERPAIAQKERSVMELFVRKLIYLDLTKRNYVKILKQLRKLHWDDEEVVSLLFKVFTKIWRVRYNNVHILAILVGALGRYHQDFAYSVIDEVLEQISLGLEQNNFKHNQRRIAQVKYLGELYNYKLIDSPVIFDALYRIVTFGHEGGTPRPGKVCPLDMPDDFFRIRLVCTLLDVCGMCFDKGSAKKKLDFFLTFFEVVIFLAYYIFTKDPLSMDIEFIIQDTFAQIRPSWSLHTSLEEAGKAFEEAVQNNYKPDEEGNKSIGDQDEVDEAESISDGEQRGQYQDEEHSDEGEEDELPVPAIAPEQPEESEEDTSSEEEEAIVVKLEEEERDPEAEAEFDRELAKLMQESVDARKFERKPLFDVPLPIKRAGSTLSREATFDSDAGDNLANSSPPSGGGMMAFSLLTKKGNRQQTKVVELPSNSGLAMAMRNTQEAERAEKMKIKELVMSYDRMEETSEIESLERHAVANGVHLKYEKGSGRNAQRGRKLSLSDVNWVKGNLPPPPNQTQNASEKRSQIPPLPASEWPSLPPPITAAPVTTPTLRPFVPNTSLPAASSHTHHPSGRRKNHLF
ncbi:ARM repeat-containing protein [Tuber magnatum]|uniref:ARM repeat-containing protein n=1 Tax=Tuber magnatum TaxID=42249 RepID=A0A317SL64_9PEZI|nr:ARM repeat-containing protein [Tuber magnatum]